jgi:hypothetical protein
VPAACLQILASPRLGCDGTKAPCRSWIVNSSGGKKMGILEICMMLACASALGFYISEDAA